MSYQSIASWYACGVLHEVFHIAAAIAVGKGPDALTLANLQSALLERRVVIPNASRFQAAIIRHHGWVASVAFAFYLLANESSSIAIGAAVVAMEAVCSDLLEIDCVVISNPRLRDSYNCGNFGLVLIDQENRNHVLAILHKMIQVTMMWVSQRMHFLINCCGYLIYSLLLMF